MFETAFNLDKLVRGSILSTKMLIDTLVESLQLGVRSDVILRVRRFRKVLELREIYLCPMERARKVSEVRHLSLTVARLHDL